MSHLSASGRQDVPANRQRCLPPPVAAPYFAASIPIFRIRHPIFPLPSQPPLYPYPSASLRFVLFQVTTTRPLVNGHQSIKNRIQIISTYDTNISRVRRKKNQLLQLELQPHH